MDQQFDEWNSLKKKLNQIRGEFYVHPREIWWCSLGVNVGSEINGKNENLERPVLIMKVYNKETMLVLPITSQRKTDKFHFPVRARFIRGSSGTEEQKEVFVALTQSRVVSSRRLLRKAGFISESDLRAIRESYINFI